MKILLVQNANYLFSWGGAYKGNRILLQGLAARGHECRILTLPEPLTYEDYARRLLLNGGKVVTSESGARYEHQGVGVHVAPDTIQLCLQLMQLIQEFKPTWTLVSEDSSFMFVAAALEADPSRVVYLARTAGNLPFGPDCIAPDPTKAEILRKVAGIITVSNYMRDYMKQWGGLESKSIYWPSYGAPPFPRYGSFDKGYVTLVNPCSVKGLPIFMELVRRMPGVEFAAVPTWGANEEGQDALTQAPNITILQPQEDINKIFEQTRVLLVPSLCADALPQIVVQAMVRGIPVMGSNLGGIPEAKLGVDYVLPVRQLNYVLKAPMIYEQVVPEQDIGPWQQALEALLTSREHYEQVSSRSREAAVNFISQLGMAPFEDYLENLAPAQPQQAHGGAAATAQADEGDAKMTELQRRLSNVSPEKRALLALRLSKKSKAVS